MTTFSIADGALVARRHGRTVVIERVTDATRFAALIGMGVREAVAAGLVAGLITTKKVKAA